MTSIVLVAFSSSALSSSTVKTTYWSFANSYPLLVSSRPTTSLLSLGQTYCCFKRDPHFLWSMLNDMLDLDSEEEYRLTGTETSPNEMVAVPMDRAAMAVRMRVVERRLGEPSGNAPSFPLNKCLHYFCDAGGAAPTGLGQSGSPGSSGAGETIRPARASFGALRGDSLPDSSGRCSIRDRTSPAEA